MARKARQRLREGEDPLEARKAEQRVRQLTGGAHPHI